MRLIDMEREINKLGLDQIISVSRADSSAIYDRSNVATNAFEMTYRLAFHGSSIDLGILEVNTDLGSIQVTIHHLGAWELSQENLLHSDQEMWF